jgi:hypothetical protein
MDRQDAKIAKQEERREKKLVNREDAKIAKQVGRKKAEDTG